MLNDVWMKRVGTSLYRHHNIGLQVLYFVVCTYVWAQVLMFKICYNNGIVLCIAP